MRKIITYIRCLYANKAAFSGLCLIAASGSCGVILRYYDPSVFSAWISVLMWLCIQGAALFLLTGFGFDTYYMYMRTIAMLKTNSFHQGAFLEIGKKSAYCRKVGCLLAVNDWQKRRPEWNIPE
ncbi:MAG: hypothetical protein U1A25_00715 [Candidatus Sungbacteria bacterium]|nr:hypothetical protein [Candidatus Sungbacteria bacterium]